MTIETGIALGMTASLLHLGAFIAYHRQMLNGDSCPNAATWGIWAVGATLNAASYFFMNGDFVKSLLPIIGSLACIWVFVLSLIKGRLSRPDWKDMAALAAGLLCLIVWQVFKSVAYANLSLQFGLIVSIIPTVRGVARNPRVEKAIPWFMWGCAYALMLGAVAVRWQDIWQDLALPLIGMTTHSLVGILALRKT